MSNVMTDQTNVMIDLINVKTDLTNVVLNVMWFHERNKQTWVDVSVGAFKNGPVKVYH